MSSILNSVQLNIVICFSHALLIYFIFMPELIFFRHRCRQHITRLCVKSQALVIIAYIVGQGRRPRPLTNQTHSYLGYRGHGSFHLTSCREIRRPSQVTSMDIRRISIFLSLSLHVTKIFREKKKVRKIDVGLRLRGREEGRCLCVYIIEQSLACSCCSFYLLLGYFFFLW